MIKVNKSWLEVVNYVLNVVNLRGTRILGLNFVV